MRGAAAILAVTILSGCAAGREQVVTNLGSEYIGRNIDVLIVKLGPPTSSIPLTSGGASYQWQLSSVTDVSGDRYGASASSRNCKVRAATDRTNTIRDISTEDANAGGGIIGAVGGFGSICGRYFGMARS